MNRFILLVSFLAGCLEETVERSKPFQWVNSEGNVVSEYPDLGLFNENGVWWSIDPISGEPISAEPTAVYPGSHCSGNFFWTDVTAMVGFIDLEGQGQTLHPDAEVQLIEFQSRQKLGGECVLEEGEAWAYRSKTYFTPIPRNQGQGIHRSLE